MSPSGEADFDRNSDPDGERLVNLADDADLEVPATIDADERVEVFGVDPEESAQPVDISFLPGE